jgi:regulator of replication initiation timing
MNVKHWLLWVCLALIFVSQVLLFRANQQKTSAQTDASEAHKLVDQLQAQLDDLKASSITTLSLDNARLRADNQSLAQKLALANTNLAVLLTANDKVSGQLQTARQALRMQQDHLQQLTVENQQAQAETAAAQRDACLENLRQIEAAKQEWAVDNAKAAKDVPTAQDLVPYLKGNVMPVCPSGGYYTIGAMDEAPTCSVSGHSLQ